MARVKKQRIGAGKAPKVRPLAPSTDNWWNVEASEAAVAENRRLADLRNGRASIRSQAGMAYVVLLACIAYNHWSGIQNSTVNVAAGAGLLISGWLHRFRMFRIEAWYRASNDTFTAIPQAESAPRRELSERQRLLQEELRRASRDLRRYYLLSIRVAIVALAAPVVLFFLPIPVPDIGAAAFSSMAVCCVVGAIVIGGIFRKGNRVAEKARLLIENAGVEGAGAVIEFIESSDPNMHPMALAALPKLLSSMRASDAPCMSADQRRFLYSRLQVDRAVNEPKMALAVLHMVEQFGDPNAERFLVDLMAQLQPNTPQERALMNAAHNALGALRHADATLSRRGTLLSPATAPSDPEATLLRASGAAGQHSPDKLLRAPTSENDVA